MSESSKQAARKMWGAHMTAEQDYQTCLDEALLQTELSLAEAFQRAAAASASPQAASDAASRALQEARAT